MKLNEIKPPSGSTKSRKRHGRGIGSGRGGTSGRGHKGQNSRSGGGVKIGFEGGQMPIQRRLPKRGFTNIFRKEFEIVNLFRIAEKNFKGEVTPEILRDAGLINQKLPVKVLGEGELKEALTIKANAFTQSAVEKIEKAGGKAEVIS